MKLTKADIVDNTIQIIIDKYEDKTLEESDVSKIFIENLFRYLEEITYMQNIYLHKIGTFAVTQRKNKSNMSLYVQFIPSKYLKQFVKEKKHIHDKIDSPENELKSFVDFKIKAKDEQKVTKYKKDIIKEVVSRASTMKIDIETMNNPSHVKPILLRVYNIFLEIIQEYLMHRYIINMSIKEIYINNNKKYGFVIGQRNIDIFIEYLNKIKHKDLNNE